MWGIIFWICVMSILYTYLGYPALLTVLAQVKHILSLPPHQDHCPSMTLLIAAHNEEHVLRRKLDNALSLDYPPAQLQIIVAADGSDDATPQIVQEYVARGVELSYIPERRGKTAAINRAIPLVTGEIIVFSDANNLYDARVLRRLAGPFSDPSVGATTGAKLVVGEDGSRLGASEGLYWQYESYIKKQETRLGSCTGVAGEILAIRRELFAPIPGDIINDDFFIAARLIKQGYRVVYVPEAKSYERVSLSAQDEIVRRTRIVAGRYQAILRARELLPFNRPVVVWQIVSHKFLRPLVPLAMIGALVSNVLAILFPSEGIGVVGIFMLSSPFGSITMGLQLTFYAMAAIGNLGHFGGIVGKMLYIPAFFVNSNYAALAGLLKYVTGRQTVLWQRVSRRG